MHWVVKESAAEAREWRGERGRVDTLDSDGAGAGIEEVDYLKVDKGGVETWWCCAGRSDCYARCGPG